MSNQEENNKNLPKKESELSDDALDTVSGGIHVDVHTDHGDIDVDTGGTTIGIDTDHGSGNVKF